MKKKLIIAAAMAIGFAGNANAEQQYCREFSSTITVGSKAEKSYGTACLQPDGSWKIVSDNSLTNQNIFVAEAPAPIIREKVYIEPAPRYTKVVYRPAFGWEWKFREHEHKRHGHHNRHDHHNRYDRHGKWHDKGRNHH